MNGGMTRKEFLEALKAEGVRLDFEGLDYMVAKGLIPPVPLDGSHNRRYGPDHLEAVKKVLHNRAARTVTHARSQRRP